ncbi:MAG: hypothetical protein U1E45_17425 [Geminicoccaceae bacterium]
MNESAEEAEIVRLNARPTDAFDLFNFHFYEGPNPYLSRSATVFDFSLTRRPEPLPQDRLLAEITKVYPHLTGMVFPGYAWMFARIVAEASRLDMGLGLDRFSVVRSEKFYRIAVESIHRLTSKRIVFFVWDWLEAIGQGEIFDYPARMARIQHIFNRSAFGGPTTYALLQAAHRQGVPTLYLRDEGLMQYGYGRKQVRGVSTTFSTDSQLDSDFTTRKDDCKAFLTRLGFPAPHGDVVTTEEEAIAAAEEIGYPVAVKPLAGHKGIGVTAAVPGPEELRAAFARAGSGDGSSIIVETSLPGTDFRLLCVNGRFVAALERRPAWIEGDGRRTVTELIEIENARPARADNPASPLGKIIVDEAMDALLKQQDLTRDSVPEKGRIVWLRKVANLSAGGVSIDVTSEVHVDNMVLAQEIASYFRLTCLGIDVMAESLARSWKEGGFGIIEFNAAPGVYMHVNPAVGEGVDVPGAIIKTHFPTPAAARIPIFVFNRIEPESIKEIVDLVLSRFPTWNVGAVCPRGVFMNRAERPLSKHYNANVRSLLRSPKIDLLIVAYDEATLEDEGMIHVGHNIAVLDKPTPVEETLARDLLEGGTMIKLTGDHVLVRRGGLIEEYTLDPAERFGRVFLREIAIVLGSLT